MRLRLNLSHTVADFGSPFLVPQAVRYIYALRIENYTDSKLVNATYCSILSPYKTV